MVIGGTIIKMENEKLINVEKLKLIFKDVFDVFEKYNLTKGEIEFVISDLKKVAEEFGKEE